VNNLVHFAGVGVYQLHSAQVQADPCPSAHPPRAPVAAGGGMAAAADAPTELLATAAESLVQSLPYDAMNAEQSHFRCFHVSAYISHHLHITSEAELAAADALRRRHQGAGGGRGRKDDHMSAWLMDEDGEMLSDYEDEEEDGDSEDEGEGSDGMGGSEDDEGQGARAVAGGGLSDDDDDDEAGDSSAADDAAAAAEWRLVRQAALQDRDYPDEVDVPVDASARQRFARFRSSSFTPTRSRFLSQPPQTVISQRPEVAAHVTVGSQRAGAACSRCVSFTSSSAFNAE
jgi:hypothetical protein